jgi:hypothetical protein
MAARKAIRVRLRMMLNSEEVNARVGYGEPSLLHHKRKCANFQNEGQMPPSQALFLFSRSAIGKIVTG